MAQLTWRNVDAPNFSGVAAGYKAFSDLISNAGKTASDAIGTYDDTTRMDAANPGIQAYFQAAAQGNPNAAKEALAQHSAAFGNLRPDQLAGVLGAGGKMTSTSLGNQGDYFKNMVGQRNDLDQQSAVEAANRIGKMIGVNSDLPRILGQDASYKGLSATAQQMTQNILAGNGWQKPYSPGAQGSGSSGVPSLGSGSPAAAAIGGAVGTANFSGLDPKQASRLQAVKFSPLHDEAISSASGGDASKAAWLKAAVTIENRGKPAPDDNAISPAKAAGAFQFMSATGKQYGLQDEDRKDFTKSAGAAGKFYDDLHKMYKGNQLAMLAHYNGGGAAGAAVMAGKEPSAQETRDYVNMGRALGIGGDSTAANPTDAWRSKLDTPGELGAASGAAKVDMAMAKSMRNLSGLQNIMGKAGDLTNDADVAAAVVTKYPTVPHATMLGEINRISKEHKISAAQAGEILLNKGMTAHKGSGAFGIRYAKDWLMGDTFLDTGYAPNEDVITSLAKAIKTPQAQQKVAENDDLARADASLTAAQEKFTAENDVLKQLRIRAVDNPELAGSVLAAEGRAAAAMKKWQNLIRLQNGTKGYKQEFPENDGNMPPAVREALGLPPGTNQPVNTGEGNYGAGPAALAGIASVMLGRSVNGKVTPTKQPVTTPDRPQTDPRDNWKNLSAYFGSAR